MGFGISFNFALAGYPVTIYDISDAILQKSAQRMQKALNIFGGYGLMNEYPVQRHLRDSYFPMIGGGTSDIMRLIVARQLELGT